MKLEEVACVVCLAVLDHTHLGPGQGDGPHFSAY